MEEKTTTQLAADLIKRDFELETTTDYQNEDELFRMLADQIAWMIERRMEWLLSLMYRMDIDEAQVQAALSPVAPEPANIGLARLVLERQKQRVHTKQTYRPSALDEEWDW
jgi:hypothetical protein